MGLPQPTKAVFQQCAILTASAAWLRPSINFAALLLTLFRFQGQRRGVYPQDVCHLVYPLLRWRRLALRFLRARPLKVEWKLSGLLQFRRRRCLTIAFFAEYWDEAKCDLILQDTTSDLKFLWRTHKVPREAQARLAAFGFSYFIICSASALLKKFSATVPIPTSGKLVGLRNTLASLNSVINSKLMLHLLLVLDCSVQA